MNGWSDSVLFKLVKNWKFSGNTSLKMNVLSFKTLYRFLPTPEATKHQQNRAFSKTNSCLNLTQVEAIAKQRDETQ